MPKRPSKPEPRDATTHAAHGPDEDRRAIARVLDRLSGSAELLEHLGCEGDDPRFHALLERVRRTFPLPQGAPLQSALDALRSSRSRAPTYSLDATPAGWVPPPATEFDREHFGLLHAPTRRDGTIAYATDNPPRPSLSDMHAWITAVPSVLDAMTAADELRRVIDVAVADRALTEGASERLAALIEDVADTFQDPPKYQPRGRRELLRLVDDLPDLFPALVKRADRDVVVHIIGEAIGIANAPQAGASVRDARQTRRERVEVWRKDEKKARKRGSDS